MPWQLWIFIKSGVSIFISEHPSQADARWWAYAWMDRGFIPVPQVDPLIEVQIPFPSADVHAVYIIEKAAAAPAQPVTFDPISGLDPEGIE